MTRTGLSFLMPAALWTAALLPAAGQGAARPPARAPSAAALESEVVGTIGDSKFTFGEVIAHLQKDNPQLFAQAVDSVVAPRAYAGLFGTAPKPSVTLTRTEVVATLRQHPTKPLADELNTMIEMYAVDHEAAKAHVVITPTQVENRINLLMKKLRTQGQIPPNLSDEQFLVQQHVTRDQLRKSFRPQVQLTNLIQKDIEARFGHPVSPDDYVKVRHILVTVKSPANSPKPEDKKADAEALAKIQQIAADIRSGKTTFDEAAKQNSDDPGSKQSGGELGVAMRGVFDKDFEKAAFSQKPSEVGQPVRSQFGYHIIEVEQAGKDIPADERQTFLDGYMSNQLPLFLRKLTTVTYKTTNKLAALAPQPQMPAGVGG